MAITRGTRLGPYEVQTQVGAGGMGAVYKARDTRLGRSVAVKVMLQQAGELRDRFEQEARVVASLQHPNICTLLDVGEQESESYLVMEYLEGETLRCPQPLAKVMEYGMQIADALEAAHRAGITHRDLKPANIMITRSGVKLLDFGIAKWRKAQDAPPEAGSGLQTVTQRSMTTAGALIGTPLYMAPEQLNGGVADARTDLWALGCVLYEMATGATPFRAPTQPALLAAILEREPDPATALQPAVPASLERLLRRCLAKDPERRWQSALDVRLELEAIRDEKQSPAAAAKGFRWMPWAAATATALLAGAAGWMAHTGGATGDVVRFELDPPINTVFRSVAISPDGRKLLYSTAGAGGEKLYLRHMDRTEPQPVAGGDGGRYPFWAPDSSQFAFFAGGKLKRAALGDSMPVELCDLAGNPAGGAWNGDGVIVYGGLGTALLRIPAAGGTPAPVTKLEGPERWHGFPQFTGDSRLVFIRGIGAGWSLRTVALAGGDSAELVANSRGAAYMPGGYLLYDRQGALLTQKFDVSSGTLTGDAEQIDASLGGYLSYRFLAASAGGTLVHMSGGRSVERRMVWLDRAGRELRHAVRPAGWEELALSRQGQIAAVKSIGENADIWLADSEGERESRLTFDTRADLHPVWSHDGKQMAYWSSGAPRPGIYMRSADGAGAPELLMPHEGTVLRLRDWSADGKFLIYWNSRDLMVLPVAGDRKAFPFLNSAEEEDEAQFSPLPAAGAPWVAYSSNETGPREIFLVRFAGAPAAADARKYQMSSGGGRLPRWRADGRELYYMTDDHKLMAVDVAGTDSLQIGKPRVLFQSQATNFNSNGYHYAASGAGEQFLFIQSVSGERPSPLVVTLHWRALLQGPGAGR
jgi:eukaryotic-like serine/threonine-protein kinase